MYQRFQHYLTKLSLTLLTKINSWPYSLFKRRWTRTLNGKPNHFLSIIAIIIISITCFSQMCILYPLASELCRFLQPYLEFDKKLCIKIYFLKVLLTRKKERFEHWIILEYINYNLKQTLQPSLQLKVGYARRCNTTLQLKYETVLFQKPKRQQLTKKKLKRNLLTRFHQSESQA